MLDELSGRELNLWQRLKRWIQEPMGSKRDLMQCEICGEWGKPNPNYDGVRTFVHTNRVWGTPYMHSAHVAKQALHDLRKWRARQ